MQPGVQVAKRKPNRFSREFKIEAVRMMKSSSKPAAELANDLGVSEQSLYRWVKELDIDERADPSGPPTTAEREELSRLRRELKQVQMERDFLEKDGSIPRERKTVRFQVIQLHRTRFPVEMMCRLLEVSPSGYYAWAERAESNRARADRKLTVEIRAEFEATKGRYGSQRVARALTTSERKVGRRRAARIMRQEGLAARPRRARKPRTTDSNHERRIAPNILARDFTIDKPNKVSMGDIPYIATFAGRMYLAVIIDLFSRKVIGWALAEHIRDDLALEALDMAVRSRGPARGVLHHSDRGSQHASDDYVRMPERRGFIASMSRKGDCWDYAVVESFFATLKTELGDTFESATDARTKIDDYINTFYNYRRLHSSIGYVSPAQFEMNHKLAAHAA